MRRRPNWWPWHRDLGEDRAGQALAESEEQYQQVKGLSDEVEEVTNGLRELREQNNFAAAIEKALRAGR